MQRYLTCRIEKCTGCKICELVCTEEKEGLYNPLKSRIKVVRIDPITDIALPCRFCEKPSCVRSCPRNALQKSQKNGVILVDETKCIGCGWCMEACEFGALTAHPDKKVMIVCDLCQDQPKCVTACPFDALEVLTPDILAQRARNAAVESLFRRGS